MSRLHTITLFKILKDTYGSLCNVRNKILIVKHILFISEITHLITHPF